MLHSGIGKKISSLDSTALSWQSDIDEILDIPDKSDKGTKWIDSFQS